MKEGDYRCTSTLSLVLALDVGHPPVVLPPGKRPDTHYTEGWVDPTVSLEGCGKFIPHRDSIPGPSRHWRVAIPTTLPQPTFDHV